MKRSKPTRIKRGAAAAKAAAKFPINAPKPPYYVPTMDEVRAIPPNGIGVVTTFAGGGGSSTGYRMAGCKILLANEFERHAQDTYRANKHPDTILDGSDLHKLTGARILEQIGLQRGELDIFDGSPPCQAFSTAGPLSSSWGKLQSDHGSSAKEDLFFDFVRVMTELQPRVFVAENVTGLIKGVSKGYFLDILKAMQQTGYRVEAQVLNAAYLGVPQARQRVIFVGVREDVAQAVGCGPVFPKPLPYVYTVRDVLPKAIRIINDAKGNFKVATFSDEPAGTITAASAHHWFVEEYPNTVERTEPPKASAPDVNSMYKDAQTGARIDINDTPLEQYYDELTYQGEVHKKRISLVKVPWDAPHPTIGAMGAGRSLGSVMHPEQRRKLAIGEVKIICSFPPDYILTGSHSEQWKRMGNAVPPFMIKALAEVLRDRILLPYHAHIKRSL